MNKLIIVLAALAIALLGSPAAAQAPQGAAALLAACTVIDADAERLACYDKLFRTNTGTAALSLQSEQQLLARPSGRAYATLTLYCDAGAPRLEFAFAGNPLSATGSNVGVSIKRDLRSSRALSLRPSADGTMAVMDQRSDIETFVQSLQGVGALSLETRTTDYRSLSVRFQIGPRAGELAAALAACR